MLLTVQLEGKTVPLDDCEYVVWAPCGCPVSVVVATTRDDVDQVVTEADAWRMLYPLKRDREAAKKRGLRMELMTHARCEEVAAMTDTQIDALRVSVRAQMDQTEAEARELARRLTEGTQP